MSISLSAIDHLAKLARLNLTKEEKERYQKDISSILAYVEKVQSIPTAAPIFNLPQLKAGQNLREDKIISETPGEIKRIIESFPEREGELNKVKAVFEE